ncbi:serine/arginine repetitive matrix protein 2-like [Macrobrachium nipponense]|uniref:serine/arginine repetitive matrix protein 2-like n=1 Tax=Macrobrachium nipponense TaxID=159736 RepID=UPI0030C7AF51
MADSKLKKSSMFRVCSKSECKPLLLALNPKIRVRRTQYVRSNESKVGSYKGKSESESDKCSVPSAVEDPVARSQSALDRANKEVLKQCFSSSSSPSPNSVDGAASKNQRSSVREPGELKDPLLLSTLGLLLLPTEDSRDRQQCILAGLQAQISALANSLTGSSHRRKDISLPVKKSKKDSADFSPNAGKVQEPRSRASFIKERLSRSPSRRSPHASRRKDLDRRSSPELRSPSFREDRHRSPKTRSSSCKRQEFDKNKESRSVQDRSRRSSPGCRSPLHKRTETSRHFSPDFVSSPEIRSPSAKIREDSRRKEPSKRQTRLSPSCERTRSDRHSVPRKRFASDRRSSSEDFSLCDRRQEPDKRVGLDKRQGPDKRLELDRRLEPSRRKFPDRRSPHIRSPSVVSDKDLDRRASSSRRSFSRGSPSRRSPYRRAPSRRSPSRRSPGRRSPSRRSPNRRSPPSRAAPFPVGVLLAADRPNVFRSEEGTGASVEDLPKDSSGSCYKRLTELLLQEFGESLSAVAPPSPPSLFSTAKTSKTSSVVKMKPTVSMKKALKSFEDWLVSKEEKGKTVFFLPTFQTYGKMGFWYESGEPLGLTLPASADSDFSSLVDSARRSALNSVKTTWGMSELDPTF